ncbi:MAG: transporter [Nitrospirota bacterium]
MRAWTLAAVSVVLVGTLAGGPAWAARPFLSTERGPTLDHGTSRVEVGLDAARFSSQTTRYTLKTELTSGLLTKLDFKVEAPYLFTTGPGGTQGEVGDVLLRPKLLLLEGREANPLFIAAELVLKFPSCDEGSTAASVTPSCTGEADLGVLAIASKEFRPVTVHLNLGYTFVGSPPGRTLDDVVNYSLAFEYDTVLPAITVVTELAGVTSRESSVSDDLLDVMIGVTYEVNRRVVLDTSLAVGLSSASPDYAAALGVSYTF